jgi:hypothetical protein
MVYFNSLEGIWGHVRVWIVTVGFIAHLRLLVGYVQIAPIFLCSTLVCAIVVRIQLLMKNLQQG